MEHTEYISRLDRNIYDSLDLYEELQTSFDKKYNLKGVSSPRSRGQHSRHLERILQHIVNLQLKKKEIIKSMLD